MEMTTSSRPLHTATAPLIPREVLSIDSAVAIADNEHLRREETWSSRLFTVGEIFYSIRLPDHSGEASCARCGMRFRAAGPTGHANEEPICDLCLLECEEELGMVLALVAMVRGYAALDYRSPREHWDALKEVGAFARIYERLAAASSGPARQFRPKPPRRSRF